MAELVFKEGLRNGIRSREDNERNSDQLTVLYNAKPGRYGLVQHAPISYPATLSSAIAGAGITVSHPFPQLFRGGSATYLFSETGVWSVNETAMLTGVGTVLTALTLKKLDDTSGAIASGGGAWQFADCGKSWWAFNGTTTVFYAEVGGVWAVRVDTAFQVPTKSGCHFRGRAIFGGFDANNYWNSVWDTNIAGWTDEYIVNPGGATIAGIGSNFVSWSSIGGGDVLGMLYPELMVAGHEKYSTAGHDATKPILNDFLDRNECGWMPMEWAGTVICLKPLGDSVIVYGDNGISALTMVSSPVPTFGMQTIAKFGVASRTAVGGDEEHHLFMDGSGMLWEMGVDRKLIRRDHQESFLPFVGEDISIVHDPQLKEFHITGTVSAVRRCYTLTESGLYRHKHPPTSAFFLSGGMVGIYETLSSFDTVEVRTDTVDFETRDIKTVHNVQVGSTVTSALSCRIYYRSDSSADWSNTGLVALDLKGNADILVSGVEFQVEVYGADYTDFERIDYIKLLWREQGVRNFRGST